MDLCIEVRADRLGCSKRCSLMLLAMMLLLVVMVDVVVVVLLQKIQFIKDGGGTGHQACRYCLKTT